MTKWTKACVKRLARSISHITFKKKKTSDNNVMLVTPVKIASCVFCQYASFARDLQDSKATAAGLPFTLGEHTSRSIDELMKVQSDWREGLRNLVQSRISNFNEALVEVKSIPQRGMHSWFAVFVSVAPASGSWNPANVIQGNKDRRRWTVT